MPGLQSLLPRFAQRQPADSFRPLVLLASAQALVARPARIWSIARLDNIVSLERARQHAVPHAMDRGSVSTAAASSFFIDL